MHHLLKRQLKKANVNVDKKFLELVNQAYVDADEDRTLLEHSLEISSCEMKELYEKLEKKSQDKLRKSEERYNKLVTALEDYYFFYAYDLEGVFLYVSDSVKNILGYTVEEFSKHYSTYLTDEELNQDVEKYTQQAIEGEQQAPYILSIFRSNKKVAYLEVSEFPVINESGNVIEIQGIAKDITMQYLMQQELDYMSQHDSLTGILNRLSLYNKLEYIIALSQRNKKHFAVLFLDLDHFKEVNDTLGHNIGDMLLKEVVKRVESHIRKSDVFARIGGDEFVIVLTDVDESYVSKLAQKLIDLLQKEFLIENHIVHTSTSMGIALYPNDATTVNDLLNLADEAMYTTKSQGRNSFTYYSKDLALAT